MVAHSFEAVCTLIVQDPDRLQFATDHSCPRQIRNADYYISTKDNRVRLSGGREIYSHSSQARKELGTRLLWIPVSLTTASLLEAIISRETAQLTTPLTLNQDSATMERQAGSAPGVSNDLFFLYG
ncbi:hypothetical protein Ddc_04988 [Ditylenchus destructor]|nr:hypothetical protein Ddc_04988 [Ditylenchus destructor]